MKRRVTLALLVCAGVYYAVASWRIVETRDPWIDEGWNAASAYSLAFRGYLGNSVLEPTGSWLMGELKGIDRYTYWTMPLNLLLQAGCYRAFGFGIVQLRLVSIFWGFIALAAWWVIVSKLSGDRLAAALTVALLAIDFSFLWSATDGRMDMMCIALGAAGIAFYLSFEERNFRLALIAANCCLAAALFTHPNGIVFVGALGIRVFWKRRQLALRDVVSVLPYVVFAGAWGIYIAQRPDFFLAQFGANSHPPGGARGGLLFHPAVALQKELLRYVGHFGVNPVWADPMPGFSFMAPLIYWAGTVVGIEYWRRKRPQGLGFLLAWLGLTLAAMTFLDSLKAHNYLPLVIPVYLAVLAVVTSRVISHGTSAAVLLITLCAALCSVQVGVLKWKVTRPNSGYSALLQYLKSTPGTITGSSVLLFGVDTARLTDDARLGLHSGKTTDLIVVDPYYRWVWNDVWREFDPAAFKAVQNKLAEYRPRWEAGKYRVYARR